MLQGPPIKILRRFYGNRSRTAGPTVPRLRVQHVRAGLDARGQRRRHELVEVEVAVARALA